MRITIFALALIFSLCAGPLVSAAPPQDGNGLGRFDRDLQRLAKKVKPSVVSVRVVAVSEERAESDEGAGGSTSAVRATRRVLYRSSGLVATRGGEIVTVISDFPWEYDLEPTERIVTEIEMHDGALLGATIGATDPETGITLLTLDDPPQKLRPVRFAKSAPQQGGTVVSVGADGFALGYIAHPARGIALGSHSFPRGIVTSIEAQAGDVGGMLANPEGELVGILAFSLAPPRSIEGSPETGFTPESIQEGRTEGATADSGNAYERAGRSEVGELVTSKAILLRDGVPLGRAVAIPADLLHRIVGQLRKNGEMRRGALGATFQFHHPALNDSHIGAGALVRKLTPGGTAEAAGLRVDDVIQKIEKKHVRRPEDLLWFREIVEYGEIGHRIAVKVARMENHRIVSKTIYVAIGTRPEGGRGDELEEPCHPECVGKCGVVGSTPVEEDALDTGSGE